MVGWSVARVFSAGKMINRNFYLIVLLCHLGLTSFSSACKPLFIKEQMTPKEEPEDWEKFDISKVEKRMDQCECGWRPEKAGRIAGGEAAEKNEFPWQAALVYRNTRVPFCGGTLLNNLFVLTAAHCVLNLPKILMASAYDKGDADPERFRVENDFQVLLNAHRLTPLSNRTMDTLYRRSWNLDDSDNELDFEEGTIRFDVEKSIFHPKFVEEYRKMGFDFDVALLKLRQPVTLNTRRAPVPVCLPEENKHDDYDGVTALTIGWGRTNYRDATSGSPELLKLPMPVYSLQECMDISGIKISSRFICAGHQTKKKDIGKADSGGPLLMQEGGRSVQIGIVSWGAGEMEGHVVSGFTRVTAFLPWIYYQLNKHDPDNLALWCNEFDEDSATEALAVPTTPMPEFFVEDFVVEGNDTSTSNESITVGYDQ